MAILKPNIPLKYVKPDGTTQSEYPLTSIDQVIDEDGIHRLNQTIVRADLSDVEEGTAVPTNADLLDNHPANYFATSLDLNVVSEELNTAIANSGKFYGIDTSNILASDVKEYTATGDCIALVSIGRSGYGDGYVYIDGVQVIYKYHEYGPNSETYVLPLKNGQKITASSQNIGMKIFGIKS